MSKRILERSAAPLVREVDAAAEIRVIRPHPPLVVAIRRIHDLLAAVVANDGGAKEIILVFDDERHGHFSGVQGPRTFFSNTKSIEPGRGGAKSVACGATTSRCACQW